MLKFNLEKRKKILFYITAIITVQGFALLWLVLISFSVIKLDDNFLTKETSIALIRLCVLSSLLTCVGLVVVFYLKDFMQKEALEIEANRLQLQQSRDIIQGLRMQRHDFQNQLSVIKVWAELNDTGSILRYLEEERLTIFDPEAFAFIRCPVLQGLFLVAQAKAAENGIKFFVESSISLEDFEFPWSKINHIFSNILNNALEAVNELEKIEDGEREIHVYISDTQEKFIFQVWTPTVISGDGSPEKVFEPGFSTKEEAGRGLGLYIVKKFVSELNGSVVVKTGADTGTEFQLEFPKKVKGFSPGVK